MRGEKRSSQESRLVSTEILGAFLLASLVLVGFINCRLFFTAHKKQNPKNRRE
jgi:hypothetical protein